jgi:phage-related tail fiber protein
MTAGIKANVDGSAAIQVGGIDAITLTSAGAATFVQPITLTTDLAVADGGTGQSSLTANNVLLGNGTSAVQFVAPGTSGNVLTSNGTTWTSATPSGVPAGTVIYYAASTAPTGYLKANGASLSTTTYAALFAAIGYTFGGSGGSFNVPDLRGEFIRGWDDGRGVDSGRVFGSAQATQTQWYGSGINSTVNAVGTFTGGGPNDTGLAGKFVNTAVQTMNRVNFPWNTATETRPLNIALLACIKF